jgi:nucleoside-diphosphate-sugar epimerase
VSTPHLLIFGPGYTASRFAARAAARGWDVTGVTRDGRGDTLAITDTAGVAAAIRSASHILSSVPPDADGRDAVLDTWGEAVALAPARWVGYLSSTGVYGDAGGAWVDESAPVTGRRAGRNAADAGWRALRGDVCVFRLPGIYGPGRSALDRVRAGTAQLVDIEGQVFSRIHVDDIAAALLASIDARATGIFNIADDYPDSQNAVISGAAALLGVASPAVVPLDSLSAAARAFYAENRRVANTRAKRELGWQPRYPTWREGLRACL